MVRKLHATRIKQPFLPHSQLYVCVCVRVCLSVCACVSVCVSPSLWRAFDAHHEGVFSTHCLVFLSVLFSSVVSFPTFRQASLSLSLFYSLALATGRVTLLCLVVGGVQASLSIAKCRMCFQVFSLQLPNPNDKSLKLFPTNCCSWPLSFILLPLLLF